MIGPSLDEQGLGPTGPPSNMHVLSGYNAK